MRSTAPPPQEEQIETAVQPRIDRQKPQNEQVRRGETLRQSYERHRQESQN